MIKSPEEVIKMEYSLEVISYETQMKELRIFYLEQRRLGGV